MEALRLGRRGLGALVRGVFPRYCAFCGTGVEDGCWCNGCRADLPRLGASCGRCANPLPAAAHGACCGECQRRLPPFSAARAVLHYTFPVDAALKALKFRRRLHYVPAFVALLEPVAREAFPLADALVPVPLHRFRQALRGFNQAHELAKPLGRALGLPICAAVRRTRRTPPQAGLPARLRRRNLENAFSVAGPLGCSRPLIVDDVMTTGETCRQLAAALLRAGAQEVGVLVVARAAPGRHDRPAYIGTGRKV